ncbi:hypothetical protein [Methylobacterium brachythecii]|uniref:Uncharacterized protein n=1 Tax=Methylobacterium brachythecii TaxID=1176177 RepID=A0A7W6AHK7_9HYPH|nr:hypothetical protein [Methylobacterium brachythecii]GLS44170.1 hypothetical protein GCM10007884_21570 [Methylobacterium brachythecii]
MRETMLQDTAAASYDADSDDKRVALGLVTEAFAEGCLDGLDGDCMAQAALFAAFQELVATYGEEATASYAEGLPERIRGGGFTTTLQH